MHIRYLNIIKNNIVYQHYQLVKIYKIKKLYYSIHYYTYQSIMNLKCHGSKHYINCLPPSSYTYIEIIRIKFYP